MGCESSTAAMPSPEEPPKKVDPRLPFVAYREVFSMKNWWKAVTRNLEDTAKDNLIRLFRAHPEYKRLYPDLERYTDEEELRNSFALETTALDFFNNLDEVMNHLEGVDNAIILLRRIGEMHKTGGFPYEYFVHMEDSFLAAVKSTLGDRYTEKCHDNFKKLYGFMLEHLADGFK